MRYTVAYLLLRLSAQGCDRLHKKRLHKPILHTAAALLLLRRRQRGPLHNMAAGVVVHCLLVVEVEMAVVVVVAVGLVLCMELFK